MSIKDVVKEHQIWTGRPFKTFKTKSGGQIKIGFDGHELVVKDQFGVRSQIAEDAADRLIQN